MPNERASVYQTGQWGSEASLGSLTAAAKRLLCTQFDTDPNIQTTPYRPQGYAANTTATHGKESTAGAISGVQCYNDYVYLLSSLLTKASPTTPSGATTARRWTFTPNTTSPDTFASYTLEKGSSAGAERLVGAVVNNLTMRWTTTEANLSGAIMGQVLTEAITMTASPTDIPALPVSWPQTSVYVGTSFNTNNVQTVTITGSPVGGNFTLSYPDGATQTTAVIAYNAIASAVQSALQALTNLGANVTVTGGPGPGTPWVVTFAGQMAGVNASLLTANGAGLTGGTSPAVTVTNTTPGGMTRLLRPVSIELAIPDRYAFGYTLNDADTSWSFAVQQGVDARCTLVLEHDSVASGYMANLRGLTTLYAKILCRGSQIAAEPFQNTFSALFPFKFIENSRQDSGGIYTSTFPMALMYDPSMAGWLTCTVDNNLSAL